MNNRIQSLKALYNTAKKASVGAECKCPSCGTAFTKIHYQQAFCKSKGGTICKDNYWNNVTPSKRNNKTRISPASAAYMEMKKGILMGSLDGKFQGYTSEGYRIIDGVAYDEFDDPMYDVDPNDDTHPFDVGDAGDKSRED